MTRVSRSAPPALLLLPVALALCLAAASPAAAGAAKSVIFFMPIGGADNPFILTAEKGIFTAAKLHPEILVARVYPFSVDQIAPYIEFTAGKGHTLIVGIGGYYADAIDRVAARMPNSSFVLVDGVSARPNVKSVTFRDEEGGFLAGIVAGVASKKGRVGFLGASRQSPAVGAFERGFRAGVAKVNPACAVEAAWLSEGLAGFNDPEAGRSAAVKLYRGGCDVVFPAAGASSLGVIEAARAERAFAIGVDADQDALAIGSVLTSVTKRIDKAVLDIVDDLAEDRPGSGTREYNLGSDGFALTDFTYTRNLLGKAKLDRIRDAVFELKRGYKDSLATRIREGEPERPPDPEAKDEPVKGGEPPAVKAPEAPKETPKGKKKRGRR